MNEKKKLLEIIQRIDVQDIWFELARRYKVQYGKIEKSFHGSRPSEYTKIELKYKEETHDVELKTIS